MSRAGGARGHRKASELLYAARHSVGDVSGLDEDKWELQHLLDTYEQTRKIIDEADERIRNLLSQIPCAELLRSVGISVAATAAL
jgi:transposase